MKANKISLIAVNQLRDNMAIGPYGPPADLQHMGGKDIPGGQAAKFNAFHLLFLKNRGDIIILSLIISVTIFQKREGDRHEKEVSGPPGLHLSGRQDNQSMVRVLQRLPCSRMDAGRRTRPL